MIIITVLPDFQEVVIQVMFQYQDRRWGLDLIFERQHRYRQFVQVRPRVVKHREVSEVRGDRLEQVAADKEYGDVAQRESSWLAVKRSWVRSPPSPPLRDKKDIGYLRMGSPTN